MPLVPYDPTGDSTNPGSEALMVNEDGLVCGARRQAVFRFGLPFA